MKTFDPNLPGRQKLLASNYGAVLTDENLETEAALRRAKLLFPLHVFPSSITPFLNSLLNEMQGERGFVGLSVLQAAATAIGSGLRPLMGNWDSCLSIWSCMVGISSSGKSMVQKRVLKPLFTIQDRYDIRYQEEFDRMSEPAEMEKIKQKVFIFQDITYEALVNDVLSNNFKGVTRYDDELLKWIDDMQRYSKGNSEQSFWTASWAPTKAFTVRRSRRKPLLIRVNHLVASVTGTTQPGLIHKFYENMRLESGYVYRMLWTFPETDRVISPTLGYKIPDEVFKPWEVLLHRLYYDLDMPDKDSEPLIGEINDGGIKLFQQWQDQVTKEINGIDSVLEMEIRGGIFGKIKEYVLRFSVILRAMHVAASAESIKAVERVDKHYVQLAIDLANYFLSTGWEAYSIARNHTVVPPEVLQFQASLRAHNYNMNDMGRTLGISRQAVSKRYRHYADKYPALFGGRERS